MKKLLLGSLLCLFAITTQAAEPEWMKYTKPGTAHEVLDNTVGNFSFTSKMWTEPKGKAEEGSGTTENKWVLGGRFVQQNMKGSGGGYSYEGLGFYGYDNYTGEAQTVWMDDMSTAIAMTSGKNAADARTITQRGVASNPMKKMKKYTFRNELKIISRDEHVYTMWGRAGQDGKEFKTLELIYKRTNALSAK